jgi:long-chain acyl-CoA synthetase
MAFIVPRDGALAPSLEEIRAFGRETLSAPKLPRATRTVDVIPRTASGKPLRRLLRDAS